MRSPANKLIAGFLLILFSVVAVAGHGLHHLPGLELDPCHAHAEPEPAAREAVKPTACCPFDHASHAAPTADDQQDGPEIGGGCHSHHDHDCLVCRFFGQAKLVAQSDVSPWRLVPLAGSTHAPVPVYTRHIFEPYTARDPPPLMATV